MFLSKHCALTFDYRRQVRTAALLNCATGGVVPVRSDFITQLPKDLAISDLDSTIFDPAEFRAATLGGFLHLIPNYSSAYVDHAVTLLPLSGAAVTIFDARKRENIAIYATPTFAPTDHKWWKVANETMPDTSWKLWKFTSEATSPIEIPCALYTFDDFLLSLDWLLAPERQLIRVVATTDPLRFPPTIHDILPAIEMREKEAFEIDAAPIQASHAHHSAGGTSAAFLFDILETTVCHAFRFPSKVFKGTSYSQQWWQSVGNTIGSRFSQGDRIDVLEIGGGLGHLADAFHKQGQKASYTICEISPTLMLHLSTRLGSLCKLIQADFLGQPPLKSYDVIVCNEVLADLVAQLIANREKTPYARLADTFSRVLRHNGMIFLSEFSTTRESIEYTGNLDHEEIAVNFTQLKQEFERVGVECYCIPLTTFLKADMSTKLLCSNHAMIDVLNEAMRQAGCSMEHSSMDETTFLAYYADVIEDLEMKGIRFAEASAGRHFGPPITDFFVLIGHKCG